METDNVVDFSDIHQLMAMSSKKATSLNINFVILPNLSLKSGYNKEYNIGKCCVPIIHYMCTVHVQHCQLTEFSKAYSSYVCRCTDGGWTEHDSRRLQCYGRICAIFASSFYILVHKPGTFCLVVLRGAEKGVLITCIG